MLAAGTEPERRAWLRRGPRRRLCATVVETAAARAAAAARERGGQRRLRRLWARGVRWRQRRAVAGGRPAGTDRAVGVWLLDGWLAGPAGGGVVGYGYGLAWRWWGRARASMGAARLALLQLGPWAYCVLRISVAVCLCVWCVPWWVVGGECVCLDAGAGERCWIRRNADLW